MTLATQCPHCHTTFRVDDSQLTTHNGLVRCGRCTRVFNGRDFLQPNASSMALPPSPPVQSGQPTPDTPIPPDIATPQVTPVEPAPALSTSLDALIDTPDTDTSWQDAIDRMTREMASVPPHDVLTPPSGSPDQEGVPDEDETLVVDDDMAGVDAMPHTAPISQAGPHHEPRFIQANRQRQRTRKILGIVMGIAVVPLLLAAFGQAIYLWRHQIAMSFPSSKPLLIAACATLGCKVGLSTDIEQLSLESSELETLPDTPGTFALTVLLRNNGSLPQAWPHIELTLNDHQEAPQVKRVFTPREYLPATHPVADGFAPNNEQQVTVRFTLSDVAAAGYRVYLFYP